MPIPGVAGTLVDVKEYKPVPNGARGPTTVQQFKIQDGQDWILGDAWGMQDISAWRGKHVIFVSNKAGNGKIAGVQIKEKPSQDGSKTYKNLSISSACTMHDKDTYEASRGAAPTPGMQPQPPAAPFVAKPPVQQQPVATAQPAFGSYVPLQPPTARPPQTAINGQTVGMSVKAAIDIMIEAKAFKEGSFDFEVLHRLASGIIGVSQRLERGELYVDPVDPIVESFKNNPFSGLVGNPPAAGGLPFPSVPDPGYTKEDTAGIERFENAIPKPRPKPTPGPGNSAFPEADEEAPDDYPF